ncbi:hypothetical protein MGG_10505 [Pyricularia oryzae 70-15]|uniref:Dynamin N-terminal domain-containing protein n=3 Tax=Pyricularia TaxID=48558 RepID=G4MS35_PYRO7|nr:uncharacterized protein MGG_10505 [Pyricularia oryzae 70-15]EHA57501.1 hypothetical protein MGG_10505 [Pyricularia oryzae 70-15]KAI7910549.1 hypothetical protein M9X92_011038 [Pyricularia oryzae]KAI7912486.1 hypothetical protein M0657_010437 [Pyricularia oryzae]
MGTGLLATNGNSATLIKVDRLRELIGTRIFLPQLVVVGDQSSGKSSVLESITGFAFPRAAELCTRYATQITCRREAYESINVTIIPHNESDPASSKIEAHMMKTPALLLARRLRGFSFLNIHESAQPPSRMSLGEIFPCVARLLQEPASRYHVELHDVFKGAKHETNSTDDIRTFIQDTYNNSRGMDLGTFSATLLAAIFKEQTKNWKTITSAYVSIAIVLVHRFIQQVMREVCLDKGVREDLEHLLVDEIDERYKRAKQHAAFLVNIERAQSPFTLDPHFNNALARTQQERVLENIKALFSMDEDSRATTRWP